MAIKTSKYTGGNGRKQLPSPYVAHVATTEIVEHVFTEAVAAADILELCYLPPNCRITDLRIQTVGTGAATLTMGLMSGDVGSLSAARTIGTELFNAQATPTTVQAATLANLAALMSSPMPRSIGVQFSANVAANPVNKIMAIITYAST
ncbi:hypothetical protein [Paracoccus hibiscisoli]|uniref:Uncharacterized protein n=1 Tax=Paracoccus hibiscisoli TaxID=2023261 RepID=A0A4U0QUL7_9RHOB|nr:hypothetical protein [Paracoccus hibiscisoli]TJZ85829.1 hypothetical protein FA740_05360 [Paracoccus hibiscisoli]